MIRCGICPRQCRLGEGDIGFCKARANRGGKIVCDSYGKITSIALDPIEKKPLKRFHPGSNVLSVGSFGCNLRCPFCQNHEISMGGSEIRYGVLSPDELLKKAESLVARGNIGLAYTYNEPLIGWEFVMDCAKLLCENGLLNVVVTNGYLCEEPLKTLLPYLHAANIDLKSFSPSFYRKIGGDLETVKRTIALSAESIHVEVTTLIVPGENDSEDEMNALSSWLASVDPSIPLHLSKFFPNYKMTDRGPTSEKTVEKLAGIAKEHLQYVYMGNMGSAAY